MALMDNLERRASLVEMASRALQELRGRMDKMGNLGQLDNLGFQALQVRMDTREFLAHRVRTGSLVPRAQEANPGCQDSPDL